MFEGMPQLEVTHDKEIQTLRTTQKIGSTFKNMVEELSSNNKLFVADTKALPRGLIFASDDK
jgi:hypothetical protein